MPNKLKFPDDFLWGAATSAYQVEGGNCWSDWWDWEQKGKIKEKSAGACDYWNRFKEDNKRLTELGVKVFRLSVEWGRIEPKEGTFSREAVQRYREILEDLKKRDIKVQLTLWHWTSPAWFSENYGFHDKRSVELFVGYAEKVVRELGSLVDFYIVFNEPMVPLGEGYLSGKMPPGFKNPFKFRSALNNIAEAHKKTYKLIHDMNPQAQVGITYLYNWYESEGAGSLVKMVNSTAKWFRIDLFGKKIKGCQDYIGVDYYRLGKMRWDPKNSMYLGFSIEEDPKNVMGWITYPEGIYRVLGEVHEKYKLPIYITENGMPTGAGLDDFERVAFIKEHLRYVHMAIQDGVDVRGYNHWSLMDNFEWLYGYEPRFGLFEVDRTTLERTPRKSALEYAKICQSNELEV